MWVTSVVEETRDAGFCLFFNYKAWGVALKPGCAWKLMASGALSWDSCSEQGCGPPTKCSEKHRCAAGWLRIPAAVRRGVRGSRGEAAAEEAPGGNMFPSLW